MELLIFLVSKEGEVASRQEIIDRLWGRDVFVDTEAGINTAIRKIRQVLGDDPERPRFLQTVTGKGYRFVGATRKAVTVPEERPAEAKPAEPGITTVAVAPDGAPAGPTPRRRWTPVGWLSIVLCAAVAVGAFLLRAPAEQLWRLHQLQNLHVVGVTSLSGKVGSPSFSPDGRQIAFAWDGGNKGEGYDVYVQVIGASDPPHRLTQHPAHRLSVAWSPDGARIAISRVAGSFSGVFLVSAEGGPERKIADRSDSSWYGSEINWSPDGKQLAMIDRVALDKGAGVLELFLLSMDTLARSEVDPGCSSAATPVFSHDGQYLIWICNRAIFSSEIQVLHLSDHKLGSLYKRESMIDGLAWSRDDRHIVFSTDDDAGALREIEFAHPSHEEKLSLAQNAEDLATSSARDGLVFVKSSFNVNIWRVDLKSAPPQAKAVIVSSETNSGPDLSPDGQKIAYESTRSGTAEIWIADTDGSNAQQISFLGVPSTGTARWSPDGRRIIYDSRLHGEASLYIYDLPSGLTHKFETDRTDNSQASYSRDGRWIYFCSGSDHDAPEIWKAPAQGGHAVLLTKGADFALESVDGNLVYFGYGGRLWSLRPDGADRRLIEGMPALNFLVDEWYPSSTGIFFMEHPSGRTVVKFFDFKTRYVRTVYSTDQPTPGWIGAMPVSSDERWLFYPQIDHASSDLMMMENWH